MITIMITITDYNHHDDYDYDYNHDYDYHYLREKRSLKKEGNTQMISIISLRFISPTPQVVMATLFTPNVVI